LPQEGQFSLFARASSACTIITLDNSGTTVYPVYLNDSPSRLLPAAAQVKEETGSKTERKGKTMKLEVVAWRKVQKTLFALLLATVFLAGCGALNPFCGKARPVPVLSSLAPNPASLTQVEQGLLLTLTGGPFYSNSIVLWNGAALPTMVMSASQLQITITTNQISSPSTAQIVVHTPANLSGDLGCDSGGDSQALTFTVT
jgi:hypothetical protein